MISNKRYLERLVESMPHASRKIEVEPGIQMIINLPDPEKHPPLPQIIVQKDNRVQWRYGESFAVSIAPTDVFDQNQLESHLQLDGSFLTKVARVTGAAGAQAICTYALNQTAVDDDLQKLPPPPNDIIVDSSIPDLHKLKRRVIRAIEEAFEHLEI